MKYPEREVGQVLTDGIERICCGEPTTDNDHGGLHYSDLSGSQR